MASVEVVGIKELRTALRRLSDSGEWTKELRATNKASADQIAQRARSLAPQRTGRLAGSIRARASQRDASVAGGGARVPYFGWIDFGGPIKFKKRNYTLNRPYKDSGRILMPAADSERPQIVEKYNKDVADLLKRAGLME